MAGEEVLGISLLLNFILFLVLGFVFIVIKTQLWEFFKIGFKLWRSKSDVLVARVHNSGNVRFNVEPLKKKMPFDFFKKDNDIVINKKSYQKIEDISGDSSEVREKSLVDVSNEKDIDAGRLRIANGVPFIVLKEDFHENIDLVNLFKPDLDAQQVNDAISQAFEDGFKEGQGEKSNLEKVVNYTFYVALAACGLLLINLVLVYMTQAGLETLVSQTVPAIQTQLGELSKSVVDSGVEFN